MANIYQTALLAKFDSIMGIISKDLGYGSMLSGLTAERLDIVQNVAEQSVLDWAVRRQTSAASPAPTTDLQHLLDEYCTLSEYL